jgi:fatty acid-binding protein DegV
MSDELIKKAVDTVKKCGKFKNIYVTRAGCTVSNHCGENTMGVLYIHK